MDPPAPCPDAGQHLLTLPSSGLHALNRRRVRGFAESRMFPACTRVRMVPVVAPGVTQGYRPIFYLVARFLGSNIFTPIGERSRSMGAAAASVSG